MSKYLHFNVDMPSACHHRHATVGIRRLKDGRIELHIDERRCSKAKADARWVNKLAIVELPQERWAEMVEAVS